MSRTAGRPKYDALRKVEKINSVGLNRLRRHIEMNHPQAVECFGRNIRLIRDYSLYGGDYCSRKYDVNRGYGHVVLRRYYEYALEAEKEDAEVGN